MSEDAWLSDREFVKAVERVPRRDSSYYIDVIDRVLDKGIVVEAWMRMRVGGIDLITIDARMIVASIDTYHRVWPARDGAAKMAQRTLMADRV